jgi:FAD synthetase
VVVTAKVLCGGTFNVLHPGHVGFLRKAKSLGDRLVVVLASDRTVLRTKGVLLAKARDRKRLVESVRFVDKAVIGRPSGFFGVVKREKPGVIALGYDQSAEREWLSRELKRSGLKTRLVTLPRFGGYSTKGMMEEYGRAGRRKWKG